MNAIQEKHQASAEYVDPKSADPEHAGSEHGALEHAEPEIVDSGYIKPNRIDSNPVKTNPVEPMQIDPDVNPNHGATSAHALQTPYMAMSVQANLTAIKFDIYAAVFSWLILAGFVVLPNTFTSLQSAESLAATAGGKAIQEAVRNVPLLPVAGVLCCIGAVGSCWLWWLQRRNYVWLISHIFIPGLSHSFIGLFMTLVNVFSAQEGYLSVTAKVTIAVTAVCGVVMLALNFVYNQLLSTIITERDREIAEDS